MQNLKTNESGRSMVEMLGILAIIGVLSVGGVYGYGVAIKKHKADELLYKASMMATNISAQVKTNNGALPGIIESFGSTSYGKFSTSVTNALDRKGFTITISEMDSAVCEQLEKMVGGMVREATCDGTIATLTYYKNLATNDEEGKNSPTGPACANVKCDDELKCFHGECKCPNGVFKCGTECCAEGWYCTQGADSSTYICAKPSGDCSSNSDCGEEEYCKFSGSSCTNPGTGTCMNKGTLTPYTLKLPKGDLTVYKSYKSSDTMNWWSAVNFCEAHDKKQLVTIADLGISDPAGTTCYFDSSKTTGTTVYCGCSGDSGCTKTTTELYDKFGTSGALWLADNGKEGPCQAYYVDLAKGYVNDRIRTNTIAALCR